MEPYLTGNEPWLVAGQQGATIWARKWGAKDWWWPIVFVEMDTGLIKIDVVGKCDNLHLDDCAELRINDREIVPNERFQDQPSVLSATLTQ